MATLTVRGHGIADVEPTRVELGLQITARADTADEAYADVAGRAAALAEVLDGLGVPAADRITEGLSLNQEPWYPDAGQPRSTGYTAWSRTRIRLRDVASLGELIGKAVQLAGAGIDGVQWQVDLDDPARLEACRRAAESARERAQAYADALGIPLGPLVAAVEAGAVPVVAAEAGGRMRGMAMASPAYPVDSGHARVTTAVDLTYELADG